MPAQPAQQLSELAAELICRHLTPPEVKSARSTCRLWCRLFSQAPVDIRLVLPVPQLQPGSTEIQPPGRLLPRTWPLISRLVYNFEPWSQWKPHQPCGMFKLRGMLAAINAVGTAGSAQHGMHSVELESYPEEPSAMQALILLPDLQVHLKSFCPPSLWHPYEQHPFSMLPLSWIPPSATVTELSCRLRDEHMHNAAAIHALCALTQLHSLHLYVSCDFKRQSQCLYGSPTLDQASVSGMTALAHLSKLTGLTQLSVHSLTEKWYPQGWDDDETIVQSESSFRGIAPYFYLHHLQSLSALTRLQKLSLDIIPAATSSTSGTPPLVPHLVPPLLHANPVMAAQNSHQQHPLQQQQQQQHHLQHHQQYQQHQQPQQEPFHQQQGYGYGNTPLGSPGSQHPSAHTVSTPGHSHSTHYGSHTPSPDANPSGMAQPPWSHASTLAAVAANPAHAATTPAAAATAAAAAPTASPAAGTPAGTAASPAACTPAGTAWFLCLLPRLTSLSLRLHATVGVQGVLSSVAALTRLTHLGLIDIVWVGRPHHPWAACPSWLGDQELLDSYQGLLAGLPRTHIAWSTHQLYGPSQGASPQLRMADIVCCAPANLDWQVLDLTRLVSFEAFDIDVAVGAQLASLSRLLSLRSLTVTGLAMCEDSQSLLPFAALSCLTCLRLAVMYLPMGDTVEPGGDGGEQPHFVLDDQAARAFAQALTRLQLLSLKHVATVEGLSCNGMLPLLRNCSRLSSLEVNGLDLTLIARRSLQLLQEPLREGQVARVLEGVLPQAVAERAHIMSAYYRVDRRHLQYPLLVAHLVVNPPLRERLAGLAAQPSVALLEGLKQQQLLRSYGFVRTCLVRQADV